jgi:hypothetical protein
MSNTITGKDKKLRSLTCYSPQTRTRHAAKPSWGSDSLKDRAGQSKIGQANQREVAMSTLQRISITALTALALSTRMTNDRVLSMFEHSDYLREQAVRYLEQAKKEEDSSAKKELLQLATICEEVANDMDDRRVSG